MTKITSSRRSFLKALGGAALALPFYELLASRPAAAGGIAKRVIFFYFPDGAAIPTNNGDLATNFHCTGSERSFSLSKQLEPLAELKDDCVFLNGLTMGPYGEPNHGKGAQKLLTGVDDANGMSLDQFLASTAGKDAPFHHLYLGAMSKQNATSPRSTDSYISYPTAGQSIVPEDNPSVAFQSLFGGVVQGGSQPQQDPLKVSVIDGVLDDMNTLRTQLGGTEAKKLDMHLESLREVEKRIKGGGVVPTASCKEPSVSAPGAGDLYNDAKFPDILKAQIDLMVLAMACGLTKVGTLQASYHTSELIMSRFPNTEMYRQNFDMRSHQASHYGDPSNQLFPQFVNQVRWWVSQFAYLLQQLKSRPDGDGTMLDTSLVLLCTEVSDGNSHSHANMPFVIGGRAGGAISTGRLLQFDNVRHSNLLSSIAHAMGQNVCFGQECSGPLPGLLS